MLRDPCHRTSSGHDPDHRHRDCGSEKTHHLDLARSRESRRCASASCSAVDHNILPTMSHRRRSRFIFSPTPNPNSTSFRPSTPAVSTLLSNDLGPISTDSPTQPLRNPQELALFRAGYQPAYRSATPQSTATPPSETAAASRSTHRPRMAEPRARVARHKGQMNFASERECPPRSRSPLDLIG